MHSQLKLIAHVEAMRNLMSSYHEDRKRSPEHRAELGLCDASRKVCTDTSIHQAVLSMIRAEFDNHKVEYDEFAYLFPVRTGWSSATGTGTDKEVEDGYAKRMAVLDKWEVAARRKLLAAVFRRALDTIGVAGRSFMQQELRRSCRDLLGLTYNEVYTSPVYIKAMEVLHLFKPRDYKNAEYPWYKDNAHGIAMRKAVLNLCITEVLRGVK